MNLDAMLRLFGLVSLCWLVIKGFAWVVDRSARWTVGKLLGEISSPWADGDVSDAAEFGIDLTRVADDPHAGGAS